MRELEGKTAFVTGAASGIGRAIARSLAREGVAVAVADIDLAAAKLAAEEIVSAGGRAIPVACDVTSEPSLEAAADETADALGNVHILCNNAGAFAVTRLEDTTRKDWEWLLEINVVGVVNGLHTFLPRMREHGEPAHVVNTASISGHLPVVGLSVYTATKFAVVGLTECLRLELAEDCIGVSVLCPGIVKTALVETSSRHRPSRHGEHAAGDDESMKTLVESGSDPAAIGDRVVEAIRAGEFYIFTHPHIRPAFETRFQEIVEAQSD